MRAHNLVGLALVLATSAQAHSVGLSRSEWQQEGVPPVIQARFFFALAEVQTVEHARQLVLEGVKVFSSTLCLPKDSKALQAENEGVEVSISYVCSHEVETSKALRVDFSGLLQGVNPGHRHLAENQVALSQQSILDIAPQKEPISVSTLMPLGIEHILTGFDHVLFVFALLLGLGSLRTLLSTVTAFTVGHSITLALTSVFHWAPSSRVVEPLIALSIVYVALENIWASKRSKPNSHRWVVAWGFGLVHGFGFAGALKEVSVSPQELPLALLGFNLGVEVGQLLLLAAPLLLMWKLGKRPQFVQASACVLSGLIALPGAYWFVARLTEASS